MRKILLWVFIAFSAIVQSQTYKISGEINTEKNEIAAGVSVLLFSDKTLVKAEIANNQGRYTFRNVKPGTYMVKTSFIGYEETVIPNVTVTDQDVTVPAIVIKESATQLSEVVIKKEKPMIQVLADKTVFNVENTINAVGNTGFELLRKAPGVIVDNNDNLIVEGKNGVQIYIDGKQSYLSGPDLVNYLKTIQANDIEAIEIITQPSSKYDAAGVAGIVNIKLKKNKNFGTNGTITTGLNVGKYVTTLNSVSFNNRNKKNNFYGSYSNRFGKNYNFINLYRSQNGYVYDSESKTPNSYNANNIKLGYDYYHNAKNTFGVVLTGNFNNAYGNADTQTLISPTTTNATETVLNSKNDVHNKTYNIYTNLNYKYQGANERTFNTDLDFGKFNSDRSNFQPNYSYDIATATTTSIIIAQETPIDIFVSSLKADYEQQLFKGKIGAGFKSSYVKTSNDFNYSVTDQTGTQSAGNVFDYTENINAAYFNYSRNLKKINFQFGLRMENTISDGELLDNNQTDNQRVKRNYTDFFPSGGITYTANDNNSFALIYSRRIERPSYQSLNPFVNRLDQFTGNRGNPFLQPQYTDNVKLSHTYKYKLVTTLSYSYITDFFAQVSQAENGNENYLISKNVANNEVINLGVSYPFKLNKWWNVYMSVNGFTSRYIPTDPGFKAMRQETLNIYGQNTFNIGKDLTMEVSGWYNSPSVWGGTYRTSSLGSLDIAFQKKFLNKKLNARLAFSDIFYTSPWTGESEFGGVSISGDGGNDSRQVRFSLSYNFGRDEVKKARTRNTGVEDEKNRIGG